MTGSVGETAPIEIAGGDLSAAISPHGAELQWLRDAAGRDLLWDGDPAWWTGRAPILFPVVGIVNGGVIRVGGRAYPMPKHGFARHRTWTVQARDPASVTFRLDADDETRAHYPFDFALTLRFAVAGAVLRMSAILHNCGPHDMPASFGFHPAFRWPLPYGQPRDAHRVRFADDEPAPIRRIGADGLLRAASEPSPVEGRTLAPRDALFVDDALVFDRLRSRQLVYGAPGAPELRLDFPAMPELGIWTKPGAPFLALEPWAGINDPEGFTGEFADKPGVDLVSPDQSRSYALTVTLVAATGA